MLNGVGLRSVRGAGTTGFVERNRVAHTHVVPIRSHLGASQRESNTAVQTKRSAEMKRRLDEHNRLRAFKLQGMMLRTMLTKEGVDEKEIQSQVTALETRLLHEYIANKEKQLATQSKKAQGEPTEKSRAALFADATGVESHEEGRAFDRQLQEETKAVQKEALIESRAATRAKRTLDGSQTKNKPPIHL